MDLTDFGDIWLVDFEFSVPPGERPRPLCLVAREFQSGRIIRQWLEGDGTDVLPYSVGPESLFVAYYASAEMGCHLALGWPMPVYVLDLFTEFRCLTNGRETPCGAGLLGALAFCGLSGIGGEEKETMRELAMRGGDYIEAEREALLDYCQTDVDAIARLLPAMSPRIDLPRALLRGRYMKAAAAMERRGVPIDVETLHLLQESWGDIQRELVDRIDREYGVFEGVTFKRDRWEAFLNDRNIPWPRLQTGTLALDQETFRKMAQRFPELIGPIHELRQTLSQLRLHQLAVGADGRNRCLLSAFRSKTGRNQPSNSNFVFGLSAWMRSLIQPPPGHALAYIDWSQQEFGIAAALSRDTRMQEAYLSGDPYLTFAKQAGAVPPYATKDSHPAERTQFKVCALAVQYGMSSCGLAEALGIPTIEAEELLRLHRSTYPKYWEWSQAAVDCACLRGHLETVFGWRLHVQGKFNERSIANFPCQANGAEMLRLACCLAVERGIGLCAPVHDAVLIEAPLDRIDAEVSRMQGIMEEASKILLSGFPLRSDAEIVRWPDRYVDRRGEKMWATVMEIIHSHQTCA